MKTTLQVLFGLALGAAIAVVCVYLGLLMNGPSPPGLRSGIVLLLLMCVTQGFSFWAFGRKIVLQVLFGLALCTAIAIPLMYSSLSFFWETRYSDGSVAITLRSDVALLLLLAITQGISFLAFRGIKPHSRTHGPETKISWPRGRGQAASNLFQASAV